MRKAYIIIEFLIIIKVLIIIAVPIIITIANVNNSKQNNETVLLA